MNLCPDNPRCSQSFGSSLFLALALSAGPAMAGNTESPANAEPWPEPFQGEESSALEWLLSPGTERWGETEDIGNTTLQYRLSPFTGESQSASSLLLPLWEPGTNSIFSQGGWHQEHTGKNLNLGLGYRFLPRQWVLLGGNLFYDALGKSNTGRVSVGAEAKSRLLDFYVNWYHGLTGSDNPEHSGQARNGDGWDMEVVGRLPRLPWAELSGQYYYGWTEDGPDVGRRYTQGQSYLLRLAPLPLLTLELEYDGSELGERDWGLSAQLLYRFGGSWAGQWRQRDRTRAREFLLRRFEQARRQYGERRLQSDNTER